MKRLRAALLRLAGGLGLTRPDAEITEELRSHLEMLVDEYRRRGPHSIRRPSLQLFSFSPPSPGPPRPPSPPRAGRPSD